MVVVTGKLVDELRSAPEEDLSFNNGFIDVSSSNLHPHSSPPKPDPSKTQLYLVKYTFGPSLLHDPLRIPVLRQQVCNIGTFSGGPIMNDIISSYLEM